MNNDFVVGADHKCPKCGMNLPSGVYHNKKCPKISIHPNVFKVCRPKDTEYVRLPSVEWFATWFEQNLTYKVFKNMTDTELAELLLHDIELKGVSDENSRGNR